MMTFDDWMKTERVTYRPTDDSVEDRKLRQCWDAAVAAERERIKAAVTRCTLLAENCDGDSTEVDTARKALACTILAAIAGYEAPAPAGTQQGLFGA